MGMHRIGTIVALAFAGCGISSDPITGDVDSAVFGAPDAGGPSTGHVVPAWAEIEDYQGCDLDLTCSDDCVAPDFDPDCEIRNLVPPDQRRPPDAAGLGALTGTPVAATVERHEEAWWFLGTTGESMVGLAQVETGSATLAAFDADGRLLARAVPREDGLLVLRLALDEGADRPVLLRCAAGEDGARVQVSRPPAER